MDSKIKIGIVGLGLIGGSIEKCLQKNGLKCEILSVSKSQNRPYQLQDLVDVDILFLCGPQDTIKRQLEEIALIILRSGEQGTIPEEKRAFAKTLITDVGSTKTNICTRADELGLENFVGGHPMAGTEEQGYESSFSELFGGCTWILTESSKKTELLEQVIKKDLGAVSIVVMDPVTHDRSAAAVSHLPLILSLGLGNLLNGIPQAKQIVGPGFKGMTRLAKGNEVLAKEIICANRNNIKEVWKIYKESIDSFLEISNGNLIEEIESVKKVLC